MAAGRTFDKEIHVKEFDDLDELAAWLRAIGIDMAQWGTGTSKNLANLWDEYVQGDLFFQASPHTRNVAVVQIFIKRKGLILIEAEQEFVNGQRRTRDLPPSEKIKLGENYVQAAYRCLFEELGLRRDQIRFLESGYKISERVQDSPSYPGLCTRYTIHDVQAHVSGLPEEDFWRENTAAEDGDPIRRHLWAWRKRP